MIGQQQAERIWDNLQKLGKKRLIALAVVGFSIFILTGFVGYFLSRPALEILYSGVDREDVGRIAAVLKEANIPFDVNSDGNTILVHYGETARARMLLAEKGLPNSPSAGNELFDKLGSLGLTSFMQEVTRVRALEGELARTIQTMRGVKAARVHLVMSDEGSFRRTRMAPTASVVIRSESSDDTAAAKAIRHLVASAVPGMRVEDVTVLDTNGVLLATGADSADGAPGGMIVLEKNVSQEILDNIRKTLTPYLGQRNFQISVSAKLNLDKRQTNETIYNPDSRVERSVKTTKQNQTSQNSTVQSPTTVERNLPTENVKADDGKTSNEESSKREELTNYELSSKVVVTTSGGYEIENISIAVLINKSSLLASLGDHASPELIDRHMKDLEQLVTSAAGANKERGDNIKLVAVDFIDAGHDLEPQAGPPVTELLLRQSGSVLNALTILVVAILLIWYGVRPATQALLAPAEASVDYAGDASGDQFTMFDGNGESGVFPTWSPPDDTNLIEDLTSTSQRSPQKRLEQIVEYDEAKAAAVLRQWMHQGERT